MVNSFLLVLSNHNHYADYFVAGRGLPVPCISIIFIKQVKKEEEEWRVRRGSSECFLNRLLTGRCQQPRVKLKASGGSLYHSFLLRRTKSCLYCLQHQQFISYGTFFYKLLSWLPHWWSWWLNFSGSCCDDAVWNTGMVCSSVFASWLALLMLFFVSLRGWATWLLLRHFIITNKTLEMLIVEAAVKGRQKYLLCMVYLLDNLCIFVGMGHITFFQKSLYNVR